MRRLRALVFDDDESIRRLLTMLLQARGYEVFDYPEPIHCTVYDAAGCVCGTGCTCGDITLTDVEMPQISGLDLVEDQRSRGCKIDPRNVALMSGGWTEERLERARALGCRTFDKPFKVPELQAWLDECEARCRADLSLRDLGR